MAGRFLVPSKGRAPVDGGNGCCRVRPATGPSIPNAAYAAISLAEGRERRNRQLTWTKWACDLDFRVAGHFVLVAVATLAAATTAFANG